MVQALRVPSRQRRASVNFRFSDHLNGLLMADLGRVPAARSLSLRPSRSRASNSEPLFLSSCPEDSHLRALPDPYVNLSIHTAPDVRPFPWQSCQWAKSIGFARRSRSNQSRAPLVLRRNRLNLRRAQRMT